VIGLLISILLILILLIVNFKSKKSN